MISSVFLMPIRITVMRIFTSTLRFKWIKLTRLKLGGFFIYRRLKCACQRKKVEGIAGRVSDKLR